MVNRTFFGPAVLLAFTAVGASLAAQQAGPSLGEIARKERERRGAQAKAVRVFTNDEKSAGGEAPQSPNSKFSQEQSRAFLQVLSLLTIEDGCRRALGKYVSLEELETQGCQGELSKVDPIPNLRSNLSEDPDYQYGVSAGEERLRVVAAPRRSGAGGFLFDGKNLFFNSTGPATGSATDTAMDGWWTKGGKKAGGSPAKPKP